MDIVYCIEKYYFKPAMVSAISLLANVKKCDKKITIHIVHNGLIDNLKECQTFIAENYNAELKFHYLNKDNIPFIVSDNSVQKDRFFDAFSIFYRLLLPEILTELDKVIYLDADTIVNNDISELWNMNVQDFSIGAVVEPFFSSYKNITVLQHLYRLGMRSVHYFNSGVLLMNLKRLREDRFVDKALNFYKINRDQLIFDDQDILNALLEGKTLFLPPKFNSFNNVSPYSESFVFFTKGKKHVYTIDQIRDSYRNPCVIHYLGHYKPWYYPGKYYINKEKYWHFYNLSPWKNENSIAIEKLLDKGNRKIYSWRNILILFNIRLYYLFIQNKRNGLSFLETWHGIVQKRMMAF